MSEVTACVCTECSHELRFDCINMGCECCKHEDAQRMVTHELDGEDAIFRSESS